MIKYYNNFKTQSNNLTLSKTVSYMYLHSYNIIVIVVVFFNFVYKNLKTTFKNVGIILILIYVKFTILFLLQTFNSSVKYNLNNT